MSIGCVRQANGDELPPASFYTGRRYQRSLNLETPESSFHAWILTGNALNLLLRSISADAFTDVTMREHLVRLDEELKDFPPDEMLTRLHALPKEDKTLLTAASRQAMSIAGENAEIMLGLGREEAEAVLRLLAHESYH